MKLRRVWTPSTIPAVCAFALGLTGCSKTLTEDAAYALFHADFEPQPITCTARIDKGFIEDNLASARMYGVLPGQLHSTNDESRACITYLGNAGGLSKMTCTDGRQCGGFPTGAWDSDSHTLTFQCGSWSKARIESITTLDRVATVSFSRSPSLTGGDTPASVPTACKAKYDASPATGTLRATLDDTGKWRAAR